MADYQFVIGDIHGENQMLRDMHSKIFAEWDRVRKDGDRGYIVHLGDYCDRGPNVKDVIDQIVDLTIKKPLGLRTINLRGNHEEMVIRAYDAHMSGRRMDMRDFFYFERNHKETVQSYSGKPDAWHKVDSGHIEWMRKLPVVVQDSKSKLIYCHAGFRPHNWPKVTEEELLYSRLPGFFNSQNWPYNPHLDGFKVCHGHTVTRDFEPYQDKNRINVDAGAVFGGQLACAVLRNGKFQKFIKFWNTNPSEGFW